MLFVLFGTQVAAPLLSTQLLLPSWQLRFAASLISAAPLALLGLALHQIAVQLSAADKRLRNRQKSLAGLALAAALGFVLLIPLQASATFRQSSALQKVQSARIANAERRLAAMRQVVATATSNDDLNRRLQELNGPVLGPADVAQSLPLLKAQVDAVLDQAAIQIRRERQANPPLSRIALLPDLARNAIADLALAIAFAALSRRPGTKRSPLDELSKDLKRRNRLREIRRSGSLKNLVDRIRLLLLR